MAWEEFWSDHGEAVVTTVVGAVLGVLVSWFFARAARRRKFIAWHVHLDEWLLDENAPRELVVKYEDVELARPRLVSVHVLNAGNRGFLESDYTKPITVRLDGAVIRSATYSRIRMDDEVDPEVYLTATDTAKMDPVRMSPGDAFNLRLIVDGGHENMIDLTASLFEQTRKPRRLDDWSPPTSLLDTTLVFTGYAIFILALSNGFWTELVSRPVDYVEAALTGALLAVVLFFATRRAIREWRRWRLPRFGTERPREPTGERGNKDNTA